MILFGCALSVLTIKLQVLESPSVPQGAEKVEPYKMKTDGIYKCSFKGASLVPDSFPQELFPPSKAYFHHAVICQASSNHDQSQAERTETSWIFFFASKTVQSTFLKFPAPGILMQ